MRRAFITAIGLAVAVGLLVTPSYSAKPAKKKSALVAYTASSLKDYLEYALHYDYCYPVKDAFEKRTCKKRWKAFAARMLKWVKKVWIVDDSVEVEVKAYSFKKRAFAVHHSANIVTNSESDVRGRVVIGRGRCDKMTGLAEVGQTLTIRMPAKKAAKHVLRRAAGEQSVKALLKGSLGRVNWCCDAATRREARRAKENCKAKLFLYRMVGFVIEEGEDTFRYRFPKGIVTRDFDVKVLGGYVPTGSGDFEKAK